jgi:hypothetical protein
MRSARLEVLGGAASGGANNPTATEQSAAPDRLQPFRSFLATGLPAAGELVVSPSRPRYTGQNQKGINHGYSTQH